MKKVAAPVLAGAQNRLLVELGLAGDTAEHQWAEARVGTRCAAPSAVAAAGKSRIDVRKRANPWAAGGCRR